MGGLKKFDIDLTGITHVVIEIFGGDNNLSDYVLTDLREMELGSTGNFAVIGLVDLEHGSNSSVMVITPDKGLFVLEKLGEIDTGDPETLANFLARALITAKDVPHKAIGFWDHGSGVFDENDPNEIQLARRIKTMPRRHKFQATNARKLFLANHKTKAAMRAMLHDDTSGGVLTNYEAQGVITSAFKRAGINEKIDLIFSDTCLNGMIEVTEQFKEFAQIIIGSEDLEPGDGWPYHEWFGRMSMSPPKTAEEWATQAIDAFEDGYDTRFNVHPCTLGAFRSDNEITDRFKDLVGILSKAGKTGMQSVKLAISDTQAFARHDAYDISHFCDQLVLNTVDEVIIGATNDLKAAFDTAKVKQVSLGPTVEDAQGLTFWFPTTKYNFRDVLQTYPKLEFDRKTGWSDYLTSHRF